MGTDEVGSSFTAGFYLSMSSLLPELRHRPSGSIVTADAGPSCSAPDASSSSAVLRHSTTPVERTMIHLRLQFVKAEDLPMLRFVSHPSKTASPLESTTDFRLENRPDRLAVESRRDI